MKTIGLPEDLEQFVVEGEAARGFPLNSLSPIVQGRNNAAHASGSMPNARNCAARRSARRRSIAASS